MIADRNTDRAGESPQAARPALRVLVVDDSRAQRAVLALHLRRWGYRVAEAASAEEALEACRADLPDIVLSDWVMPGMSGLELCRRIRALPDEGYRYFILLTSKSEKAEVADGLDGGADDFLTKPVNPDELHARLRAGERIIGMQIELLEKNRLVSATLDELQKVHASLDRDLIEARKLQQTLVRDRERDFGAGEVAALLRPSGHVGGDLAGFFEITPRRIALYSVDVSGHGVASAMMTARLAGLLSNSSRDQNIAIVTGLYGYRDAWPPETVAARFNRMMFEELQLDQYFTLAYAEIDLKTGRVWLVQAGHPHPVLIRADGRIEKVGEGGLPIGLIEGAGWQRVEFWLEPGDRLFLVSDGVTECPVAGGGDLGEEGLADILAGLGGMACGPMLEALVWKLADRMGGEDFPDDVSGVLFRFKGGLA